MILVVAGTRPEIIKMAPVYAALQRTKQQPRWLFTGQQADIGQSAFDVFDMTPEYAYDLERKNGSLPELNALLTNALQETIEEMNPQMILVQGDTLSAAVGAQQGFLAGIKTGHVEAGLRSWNIKSPYPEEACRIWIDSVADVKFAPTQQAAMTLSGSVYLTGNTVVDALGMVKTTKKREGSYAVVTMHRRENASTVAAVCRAVALLARERVFDYVVWPVHPNPIVRNVVPRILNGLRNVELIEPLPYDQMVNLVRGAKILMTDSGGLQEEALALGVPCLVMRAETERPEGVAAGGAHLVGTEPQKIIGWCKWLMNNETEWRAMASAKNPYGDGNAASRIAAVCKATVQGYDVKEDVANWKGANA